MYVDYQYNTSEAIEKVLRLLGNEKISNNTIDEMSNYLFMETNDSNLLEKAHQLKSNIDTIEKCKLALSLITENGLIRSVSNDRNIINKQIYVAREFEVIYFVDQHRNSFKYLGISKFAQRAINNYIYSLEACRSAHLASQNRNPLPLYPYLATGVISSPSNPIKTKPKQEGPFAKYLNIDWSYRGAKAVKPPEKSFTCTIL